MHFSEKHRCYWFTPRRTATRSTTELLKTLEFEIKDHEFCFDRQNKDYFFICNVKNPYSRLVSIFYLHCHHIKNFSLDFKNWVLNFTPNSQFSETYQLFYHRNFPKIGKSFDRFVRQENIVDELKSISFVDLKNEKIKNVFENQIVRNNYIKEFENEIKDKRKNWKEFYNEEIADFVYEKFSEQFQLFNYTKNSWMDGTP